MRQQTRTIGRGYKKPPSRPVMRYNEPVTAKSGWSLSMVGLTLICVFCATLALRFLVFGG